MPSNLLVDITSLTSGQVNSTWGTVPSLSASSITVAGTNSILLLIAQVQLLDEGDSTAEFRFKVNGSVTGSPINTAFTDGPHGEVGAHPMTLMWAITGLSGSSNSFSCEWQNILSFPSIDTTREHTFQIIEITAGDATILVDQSSTASATSPGTWGNLFNATGITVAGTASVLLVIANVPIDFSDGSDRSADFSFSVDGTRDGAVTSVFTDNIDEGPGWQGMLITDNRSAGSHSFQLQWQTRKLAADVDTGRLRTFQVIEITVNAFLRVDEDATSAATSPVSYADINEMTGTYTSFRSDSIHLIAGSLVPKNVGGGGTESNTQYRIAIGGTRVGSEMTTFVDTEDEQSGISQIWAATSLTGSQTFSWQWEDLGNDEVAIADTTRARTFFVVELVQATRQQISLTSDARVLAPVQIPLLSDARVLAVQQISLTSDALVAIVDDITLLSDARIIAPVQISLPSDARIIAPQQISLTSDALVVVENEIILLSDARIIAPVQVSLLSDGRVLVEQQIPLLSDAVVINKNSVSLLSDARVLVTQPISLSSDARILVEQRITLLSNAEIDPSLDSIINLVNLIQTKLNTLEACCSALTIVVGAIATDVWDVPVDDHQDSGSTGEALPERVGGGL